MTDPINYAGLAKQALGPAATDYSPDDIQGLVRAAVKKHEVDEDLALKVAGQESGFKPGLTSPKGARGVMQLMPGTAKELGVDPDDVEQNVEGGVRYLGQMMKRYKGDKSKALAAYNFGPGNVDDGKPYPAETQEYLKRILGTPAKTTRAPEAIDYGALAKQAVAPVSNDANAPVSNDAGDELYDPGDNRTPEAKEQSFERSQKWIEDHPLSSLPEVPQGTVGKDDPKSEPVEPDEPVGASAEGQPARGTAQIPPPPPGYAPVGQASPYAKPGDYVTKLSPAEETQFQAWVKDNKIPFDVEPDPANDYDMRGFWKAAQSGDKGAQRDLSTGHFPDTYKTPFHKTFSNESKYATADAPHWDKGKLVDKDGKLVADETTSDEPAKPAGQLYSRDTLELRGKNVEKLVNYAKQKQAALEKEGLQIGVRNLPGPGGGMADQKDIDAYNAKLKEHQAFADQVNAQIAAYQTDVEAYNRSNATPVEQSKQLAVNPPPGYRPAEAGVEIEQLKKNAAKLRDAATTGTLDSRKRRVEEAEKLEQRAAGLAAGIVKTPVAGTPAFLDPRAQVLTGFDPKTGEPVYKDPSSGSPVADFMRLAESSIIPPIAIHPEDHTTPILIPQLGPVNLSAVKTIANVISGQLSPESVAIIGFSGGVGEALSVLANSEKAAAFLKAVPNLAKLVDIASKTAVPAGFAGYQGYQGAEAGVTAFRLKQQAAELRQRGKETEAQALEDRAQDVAVAGATNLVMAAMSAAGAVAAGKGTAGNYPIGEIPESGSPRTTRLRTAAQESQTLADAGQRLAAQTWASQAQKIASEDWGKVFGETIQLDLNGKAVAIEYTGAEPPTPARPRGAPVFKVIDEATGQTLTAGRGDAIRGFLESRGAQTGTPKGGSVADALDQRYTDTVAERAEAQSAADKARNEGTRDLYAEAAVKDADARLSEIQKQRAQLGKEGTQLPQDKRPAGVETGASGAEIDYGKLAEQAGGKAVGEPETGRGGLAEKAGGKAVESPIAATPATKETADSPKPKEEAEHFELAKILNNSLGTARQHPSGRVTLDFTTLGAPGYEAVRITLGVMDEEDAAAYRAAESLPPAERRVIQRRLEGKMIAQAGLGTRDAFDAAGWAAIEEKVRRAHPGISEANLDHELRQMGRPDPGLKAEAPVAATPATRETTDSPKPKEETAGHDFSSTQVQLPDHIATPLQAFGNSIPKERLSPAEDKPVEDDSHITALYGLHGNDPESVRELLKNQGPITVTLGKASLFPAANTETSRGGGGTSDVLKVDVDSPDLHKLNALLATLPHTNSYPDYKPHATIAYLKPGEGKRYDGKSIAGATGQKVTLNSLTFSGKDGKRVEIPLAGKPDEKPAAAEKEFHKLPEKLRLQIADSVLHGLGMEGADLGALKQLAADLAAESRDGMPARKLIADNLGDAGLYDRYLKTSQVAPSRFEAESEIKTGDEVTYEGLRRPVLYVHANGWLTLDNGGVALRVRANQVTKAGASEAAAAKETAPQPQTEKETPQTVTAPEQSTAVTGSKAEKEAAHNASLIAKHSGQPVETKILGTVPKPLPAPYNRMLKGKPDRSMKAAQSLVGGIYESYGGGLDQVLSVRGLPGSPIYKVQDLQTGDIRSHSTFIDPRLVTRKETKAGKPEQPGSTAPEARGSAQTPPPGSESAIATETGVEKPKVEPSKTQAAGKPESQKAGKPPVAERPQAASEKPVNPAPPGPIPSGHWMNEGEIEQAVARHKNHPVLSKATKFLSDLRDETNANSDGWHSWPLPGHAAKQLMGMIQHPEYATEENYKKALASIRAFYTKRGTTAGMKFPETGEVAPAKKQTLPKGHPLTPKAETKPAKEETKPGEGETAKEAAPAGDKDFGSASEPLYTREGFPVYRSNQVWRSFDQGSQRWFEPEQAALRTIQAQWFKGSLTTTPPREALIPPDAGGSGKWEKTPIVRAVDAALEKFAEAEGKVGPSVNETRPHSEQKAGEAQPESAIAAESAPKETADSPKQKEAQVKLEDKKIIKSEQKAEEPEIDEEISAAVTAALAKELGRKPAEPVKAEAPAPAAPLDKNLRALLENTPAGRGRNPLSVYEDSGLSEDDFKTAVDEARKRDLVDFVPDDNEGRFVRTAEGTAALKSAPKKTVPPQHPMSKAGSQARATAPKETAPQSQTKKEGIEPGLHPLEVADREAEERMRARRNRRNDKPQFERGEPSEAPQVAKEDMIELGTMGAKRIVVDKLTTYPEWSARMMKDVGDLVGDIAEESRQTPDALLRKIYVYAGLTAKQFGVTPEAAPPSGTTRTIEKPAEKPILDEDAAAEQETAGRPGAERRRPPEGASAEDVPGADEERATGSDRPSDVGGLHGSTAPSDGGEEAAVQPGGRTGPRSGVPAKRKGSAASGRKPKLGGPDLSQDYRLTEADQIGEGNVRAKAEANVAAIRVLKLAESEKRPATPEEQAILAKYTGWGASELAKVFSKYPSDVPQNMKAIRAALDELLTPDEFKAAAGSTVNAHYTSPLVVRAMWDAMRHLGMEAGERVLEPSMGVGNFFGMMPEDLREGSSRTGIELDTITGGIAKLLYPGSNIKVSGLQRVPLANNFFDVAIGNVPFGNYGVGDDPEFRTRPALTRSIHNYFFAKALDKVRPGGVVAFITSSFTMDSADPSVRQYLSDNADLLGAIRLPESAFSKNAGTDVTTDVIFLRKRAPGTEPEGEAWTELAKVNVPDRKSWSSAATRDIEINQYFAKRPKMMLGTMAVTGGRYADAQNLEGDLTPELLAKAIAKLPKGALQKAEASPESDEARIPLSSLPDAGVVKDGGYLYKDGQLLKREGNELKPAGLDAPKTLRVRGLLTIRDAWRNTLQKQSSGTDDEAARARKLLNQAYDAFTRTNGPLSSLANVRAFAGDPDAPGLLGLEDYNPKTKIATKADIFRKTTNQAYIPPQTAPDAAAALAIALNEFGGINWARIRQLAGLDQAEAEQQLLANGLIYRNPEGGGFETADQYLSGKVRDKLKAALAAAESDPAYEANAEALKRVQPEDLGPGDIDARLGGTWIPKDVIAQFLLDKLGVTATIGHAETIATWNVSPSSGIADTRNETEFGLKSHDWRAHHLVEESLNLRTPTVRKPDPNDDEKTIVDPVATAALREKQQAVKDLFRKWIWQDTGRATRLAKIYNDGYNNLRLREFNGSHLKLPGSNTAIQLRPHQLNAVWRMLQGGNTLLAHVVGAGKTYEMIAGAMEMRRLGIAKKPVVIVPNHLVQQWAKEFTQLYPNANLFVAGKDTFAAGNRQRAMSRIANNDYDAVIVSHASFGKLPVADATFNAWIDEQLKELEDAIYEMKSAEGDRGPTVKDLEKAKKRLEAKLHKRAKRETKDKTLNFEDLGIDQIFYDESHASKALFFSTKMTRIAGIPNRESDRAIDMFLKTQWLTKKRNGAGVVFATGTPISNTMAEMYTVMRFLDSKGLKESGLGHFDAWAAQYGEAVTSLELAPSGAGYRMNTRFARFVNLPELATAFRMFADVQNAEMLKLPVPNLKSGKAIAAIAKASKDQKAYIGDEHTPGSLVFRAANLPKGKDAFVKGADNMLKITGDGRKAALDMRLVDPMELATVSPEEMGTQANPFSLDAGATIDFIDPDTEKRARGQISLDYDGGADGSVLVNISGGAHSLPRTSVKQLYKSIPRRDDPDSKANIAVDKIFNIWKENTAERATQLVFCDLSTPKPEGGRFSVYTDARAKLIARGIPAEQIAFIHDYETDIQKKKLFDAVNDGSIRVLFGSTEKMGVGMNVQKRLIAMHHLDAPWRPSDIEQRDGRIMRQGNQNAEVQIYRYITEGTFDAYMWQLLENKARFIAQVMSGNAGVRNAEDVDGVALTYAEMKGLASGNPLVKEKILTDTMVRRLDTLRSAYENELYQMRREYANAPQVAEAQRTTLEQSEADKARRDAADKLWRIGGKTFEGEDANARAGAAIHKLLEEDRDRFDAAQQAVYDEYHPRHVAMHQRLDAAKLAAAAEGDDYVKGSKARLKEISDEAQQFSREYTLATNAVGDNWPSVPIGTYRGFELLSNPRGRGYSDEQVRAADNSVKTVRTNSLARITVKGSRKYAANANAEGNPLGTLASIRYHIEGIDQDIDIVSKAITAAEKKGKELKELIDRPFEHADELEKLLKRQGELNNELDLNKNQAGTEGVEQEAAPVEPEKEAEGEDDEDEEGPQFERATGPKQLPGAARSALKDDWDKPNFERAAAKDGAAIQSRAKPGASTKDSQGHQDKPDFERAMPGFYSQLERAIADKMPARAVPDQIRAIVNNPQNGVKADEVKWSGIDAWLATQKGPVTRETVLGFVKANNVQVEEVELSGEGGVTEEAIDEIEKAVEAAADKWTGLDWDEDDEKIGYSYDGSDDDRETVAARLADYDDYNRYEADADRIVEAVEKVASDAAEAAKHGERAVELLGEGDLDGAVEEIDSARGLERGYGDDPAWSVPAEILDGLDPEDEAAVKRFEDAVETAAEDWDGLTWKEEDEATGYRYDDTDNAWKEVAERLAERDRYDRYNRAAQSIVDRVKGVASDAEAAADHGRKAVELLREGNVGAAKEEIDRASSLESTYGDDPAWGVPRELIHALSDTGDGPKYPTEWQLPGGKDPVELVLTVPKIEEWGKDDTHHYGDTGNGKTIAWVRGNDRRGPNGERIFHIEEIQSKRHAVGKRHGYRDDNPAAKELQAKMVGGYWEVRTDEGRFVTNIVTSEPVTEQEAIAEARRRMEHAPQQTQQDQRVPPAPFSKTWHELAFKRALRWAAENGYDQMTWTTGGQQADRYDLSKQIGSLHVLKSTTHDAWYVEAFKDNSKVLEKAVEGQHDLEELVGKEMAQRIVDQAEAAVKGLRLSGLDLSVGGEKHKKFYDEMLPQFAAKYGKKWGAKVGTTEIHVGASAKADNDDEDDAVQEETGGLEKVHSIDITPAMRASVMEGQPLFARQPAEAKGLSVIKARERNGLVWVNRRGIETVGSIWGERGVKGAALRPHHAKLAIQVLRGAAGDKAPVLERFRDWVTGNAGQDERTRAGLSALADALEAALAHNGGQAVPVIGPGARLSETKQTVLHERFHLRQFSLGEHLNAERTRELLEHPLGGVAIEGLKRLQYNPKDYPLEIGAHLAAGQYERLGLSRWQARELWIHYVTLLEQQHGQEKVEQVTQKIVPMMREALRGRQDRKESEGRADRGTPGARSSPETGRGDVSAGERAGRQAGVLARGRADAGLGGTGIQDTPSFARGLNRSKDEPAVSYSGLGAFKDKFVRNLSQLEKVNRAVHGRAVTAATSRAQTAALIRAAAPRVEAALGKDVSWLDFRRALIEGRLQGLRERWNGLAESVVESTNDDLHEAFGNWLVHVLKAIHEESIGEPLQSPALTAAALLEREDFDGLRGFLEDTFLRAGGRVARMMPESEFQAITTNPGFVKGLAVYKKLLEEPIAANHAENEGIFSDALGPLNTYYPLIRVEDEEDEGKRKNNTGRSGRAVPYRKPKNIANMFATGHAEAYDPGMEVFAERMMHAFRVNNKAALVQAIPDAGLGRMLKKGEDVPDEITVRGVVYKAAVVETKPDRQIVTPRGTVFIPAQRMVIPTWLEEELRPILDRRNINLSESGSGFARLMRAITKYTLAGPLDAVYHSANLIGTLVARTPFLGKSLAAKATGNYPFTKRVAAMLHLLSTDSTSEESARDTIEMARIGLLPEKYGSTASRWFPSSKKYAEQTGAEREWGFGPFLYGPRGIDIRARLVMYRTAKAMNPNASDQELYLFVNQLGNYTRALQGSLERSLKESGFSPFYTAGSTMVRNGVNTITGGGPMPKSGKGGRWMRWTVGLSTLGLLALWILAHKAYTGKWPWEDPHAKFLKIRLTPDHRASSPAVALWGPPSNGDAYVDFGWFNPLLARGARATGIAGAFEAKQAAGSSDQVFEAALAGAINAALHPVMGPPAKAVAGSLFGVEPYLASFRDDRGKFNPQWMPAVETQKPGMVGVVKQRVVAPILTMNGFVANVGAATGLTTGIIPHADDPANHWLRMTADLLATGLFARPSDTLTHAEFLARQRAGAQDAEKVKIKREITQAVRDHDKAKVRDLAKSPLISYKDLLQSVTRANVPKDLAGFRALTVDGALDIMEIATPEEKRRFMPSMADKIRRGAERMSTQQLKEAVDRYQQVAR